MSPCLHRQELHYRVGVHWSRQRPNYKELAGTAIGCDRRCTRKLPLLPGWCLSDPWGRASSQTECCSGLIFKPLQASNCPVVLHSARFQLDGRDDLTVSSSKQALQETLRLDLQSLTIFGESASESCLPYSCILCCPVTHVFIMEWQCCQLIFQSCF